MLAHKETKLILNDFLTSAGCSAMCLHSRAGQVCSCGRTVERLFKGFFRETAPDFLRITSIEDERLSERDTITFSLF